MLLFPLVTYQITYQNAISTGLKIQLQDQKLARGTGKEEENAQTRMPRKLCNGYQ